MSDFIQETDAEVLAALRAVAGPQPPLLETICDGIRSRPPMPNLLTVTDDSLDQIGAFQGVTIHATDVEGPAYGAEAIALLQEDLDRPFKELVAAHMNALAEDIPHRFGAELDRLYQDPLYRTPRVEGKMQFEITDRQYDTITNGPVAPPPRTPKRFKPRPRRSR